MEIKLKPNGWHRKLQVFVFGKGCPLYHNFCPYFWLTNFCILITFLIPIVPLIKLVVLIFGGIGMFFEKAGDYFEDVICKPMFESSVLKMDSESIIKSWMFWDTAESEYSSWEASRFDENYFWRTEVFGIDYYKADHKKREEQRKRFEVWKTKNPNWQELLAEYKAKKVANREKWREELAKEGRRRLEEERKAEIRKAEAVVRRQQMFTGIVKYTKWIIYPILVAFALLILYWLYIGVSSLVSYIVAHFHLGNFIVAMKVIGLIIAGVLLVVGFVKLLAHIFSKVTCRVCIKCPSWLGKALMSFGDGVVWLVRGIGDAISQMWTIIMIFKKNYCPGINWEEDKKSNN